MSFHTFFQLPHSIIFTSTLSCWNFTPDSSIPLEIQLMSGFGTKRQGFLLQLFWFLYFPQKEGRGFKNHTWRVFCCSVGILIFQQFQRWWLHKPGLEHNLQYKKSIPQNDWHGFMYACFQDLHYKIPCFAVLCSRNGHGILHGTVDAMGYWPGATVALPKAHHTDYA